MLTQLSAKLVLINGISSKLDATSVAEALEHFQLATVQRREDLGHCLVGLCVQLKNAIATFFCGGQDGVGRNEPDTADGGVKFHECLGVIQGVIKSISK